MNRIVQFNTYLYLWQKKKTHESKGMSERTEGSAARNA